MTSLHTTSLLSRRIANAMSAESPRNIVIIGGGIIGCTTAYFLTRHPSFSKSKHNITIIESQSISSAASGKSGGLLALWAFPSSIVPLSYQLHAELAEEHDGAKRWGYRKVDCGSMSAQGRSNGPTTTDDRKSDRTRGKWQKLPKTDQNFPLTQGVPDDLDWFDADTVTGYSTMGEPNTTAQVHPYLFTTSMADLAVEAGAKIILGSATALDYTGPHGIKSVTYEDKETKNIHTLPTTDVILAAGPWTSHVFPEAPITAARAHSVVVKADVSPHAIFSSIRLPEDFSKHRPHDSMVGPELYPRPDGTVYVCGDADNLVPLPKTSDLVQCDVGRCQDIIDYVSTISTPLREAEVLARQACYLPAVSGGGPLIGETGIRGLLIAAGHTCWGVQNSCATGKLMSEFVFDGKAKSAKIASLDPRKFL